MVLVMGFYSSACCVFFLFGFFRYGFCLVLFCFLNQGMNVMGE